MLVKELNSTDNGWSGFTKLEESSSFLVWISWMLTVTCHLQNEGDYDRHVLEQMAVLSSQRSGQNRGSSWDQ